MLDLPALGLAGLVDQHVTALDEREIPLGLGKINWQSNRLTLDATPQIISYRFTDEGSSLQ